MSSSVYVDVSESCTTTTTTTNTSSESHKWNLGWLVSTQTLPLPCEGNELVSDGLNLYLNPATLNKRCVLDHSSVTEHPFHTSLLAPIGRLILCQIKFSTHWDVFVS